MSSSAAAADARLQAAKGVRHPNLYVRPNSASWWARIQINGSERRFSLRTADFAEALRLVGEATAEAADERAGKPKPPVPVWESAVEAFLRDEIEPGKRYSKNMAARVECSLRQLSPALEGDALTEITLGTVWDYVRARREANPDISVSTLKNDLSAWSQVMIHAVDVELITSNPLADIASVRRRLGSDMTVISPPTDEELSSLIAEVEEWLPEMAMLMIWLRETGMRLNEALQLDLGDFLPGGGAVTLRRGVKRNKNGDRVRTIDLTPKAMAVRDLLNRKAGRLFAGLHTDPAVVSTRYGQWRRQRQGREDRAAAEQGRDARALDAVRLHDLRHAFAVASIIHDPTCLYRLQLHLGHSSVTMTERYMGHVQREGLDRGPSSRGWFGTHYGWLPDRNRK